MGLLLVLAVDQLIDLYSVFFEITNLGLVAFLLIKHFCAHKLYTTVKVNSAVHYKSMQLFMRKKPVTLFEH